MSEPFETDQITVGDLLFKVEYFWDNDSGPPWDESDGHGPVREVYRPSYEKPRKRPGERYLNRDPGDGRETLYAYDWQEACRLAKKDGWNAPPYEAPGRIQRAVQADFDFLAGWVRNEWHYCGVVVTLLDDDGFKDEDHTESLWCVETHNDYHETCAKEMAEQLAASIVQEREEEAAALAKEEAERELASEIETNTKD